MHLRLPPALLPPVLLPLLLLLHLLSCPFLPLPATFSCQIPAPALAVSGIVTAQGTGLQQDRIEHTPEDVSALHAPAFPLHLPSFTSQGVCLLEGLIQEHRNAGGTVLVATHTPIHMDRCTQLVFPER